MAKTEAGWIKAGSSVLSHWYACRPRAARYGSVCGAFLEAAGQCPCHLNRKNKEKMAASPPD